MLKKKKKERENRIEGKRKRVLIWTILQKLKMKDLSTYMLHISDMSKLTKTNSVKSLKALMLSK